MIFARYPVVIGVLFAILLLTIVGGILLLVVTPVGISTDYFFIS